MTHQKFPEENPPTLDSLPLQKVNKNESAIRKKEKKKLEHITIVHKLVLLKSLRLDLEEKPPLQSCIHVFISKYNYFKESWLSNKSIQDGHSSLLSSALMMHMVLQKDSHNHLKTSGFYLLCLSHPRPSAKYSFPATVATTHIRNKVNQYHRSRTSQFRLRAKRPFLFPYNALRMKTAILRSSLFNSHEGRNNSTFHLLPRVPPSTRASFPAFPRRPDKRRAPIGRSPPRLERCRNPGFEIRITCQPQKVRQPSCAPSVAPRHYYGGLHSADLSSFLRSTSLHPEQGWVAGWGRSCRLLYLCIQISLLSEANMRLKGKGSAIPPRLVQQGRFCRDQNAARISAAQVFADYGSSFVIQRDYFDFFFPLDAPPKSCVKSFPSLRISSARAQFSCRLKPTFFSAKF